MKTPLVNAVRRERHDPDALDAHPGVLAVLAAAMC